MALGWPGLACMAQMAMQSMKQNKKSGMQASK
jgi:hypothetical protein